MHYKGVIKPLEEIEMGTPVEIVDEEKFRLDGVPREAGIPRTGILTAFVNDYRVPEGQKKSLLLPKVNVLIDGKFVAIQAKDSLPKEAKVLKELTGSKAGVLRKLLDNKEALKLLSKNPSFENGADPELFMLDGKGEVMPAWTFLESKAKAKAINHGSSSYEYDKRYVTPFWDGVQAEFTMTRTSQCMSAFVDSIRDGLKDVLDAARKVDPKAKYTLQSVVDVPPMVLATAKLEHLALGCKPSMNIYGLVGRKIDEPRDLTWRCAAGHIHLGHYVEKEKQLPAMIKAMDAIAAVACVGAFAGYEDPRRRTLYGLPGEFRLPPHGLEYRVLANTWLAHPSLAHFTYDLVRVAAWMGAAGLGKLWNCPQDETIRVITECDVTGARTIVRKNKELFMGLMRWVRENAVIVSAKTGTAEQYANAAWKLVMEGADAIFKDPSDIEGNWRLDKPAQQTNYGDKVNWVNHSEGDNCQWHMASIEIEKGRKI